jgi:uncharacterized protein (DUF427 family)
MWNFRGQQRPDFAIEPKPGQESVWDYPRPPALVECGHLVEVTHGEQLVARSNGCLRVLETASPPTFYMPPDDVNMELLSPAIGNSYCEWKGAAKYWGLSDAQELPAVAWSYPDPNTNFAAISGWLCFYPEHVECSVHGERVRAQTGGFYGGWVTDNIVGPFKGDPGTGGW